MTDESWTVEVDPPVLLPGRPVSVSLVYIPGRDHAGRGVRAVLRCRERYRYDRTESDGKTTRTVTHTAVEEVTRLEADLAGAQAFVRGQRYAWDVAFEVPGLGPATFEGEALRCDWTLEANVDVAMGRDPRVERNVKVAQPMALLRAGVVDSGQYGLFEEAPANLDARPAQIRLEPVPVSLHSAFEGSFTVETGDPVAIEEVRLELRVAARVTVSGGHHEEIVVWRGTLEPSPGQFGGALTSHPFRGEAVGAWLPSVDLPHGRARGRFHVILARDWARDTHYERDVAIATTTDL